MTKTWLTKSSSSTRYNCFRVCGQGLGDVQGGGSVGGEAELGPVGGRVAVGGEADCVVALEEAVDAAEEHPVLKFPVDDDAVP